jgi:hypothetical protein
MQIELYNQLYKSNEVVSLLNEPEHIAIRRKELVELIKVMKNAQKIIRRDPDLMTVMKIDINDSDIAPPKQPEKNIQQQNSFKQQQPSTLPQNAFNNPNQNKVNATNQPNAQPKNQKNQKYGNLFGNN